MQLSEERKHIPCMTSEPGVCRIFLIMAERPGTEILKAAAAMWESSMQVVHTGGETLYVICNMHTTSQELAFADPSLRRILEGHCRYRMRRAVLFPGGQGAGAGREKDCEGGSPDNCDNGR